MDFSYAKTFVLTGAGYSKNFGGYLAKEMWQQIFNNPKVQDDEEIRKILVNDYDYESVYSKVLEGQLPTATKNIIVDVVLDAYKHLDERLSDWGYNYSNSNGVNRYLLSEFFNRLKSNSKLGLAPTGLKSFVFTLNQDLFMEKHWNWTSLGLSQERYLQNYRLQGVGPENFLELPNEEVAQKIQYDLHHNSEVNYVKLHGSYGWKSSDGSNQLVIGTNKESIIQKEPLLRAYYSLFQNVVREGDKKAFVIGYGFRDRHINDVLLDGVMNYGLKVYILSTQDPQLFRDHFKGDYSYANAIVEAGMRRYYRGSLSEYFPENQAAPSELKEIYSALDL